MVTGMVVPSTLMIQRHVLGKPGRADVHVAVGLEELGDVPACLGPVLRIIAPDEEEEGNPH